MLKFIDTSHHLICYAQQDITITISKRYGFLDIYGNNPVYRHLSNKKLYMSNEQIIKTILSLVLL